MAAHPQSALNFWEDTHARNERENLRQSTAAFVRKGISRQQFIACIGDVEGKRVLDMGCGSGELSVYLAQQGAQVTAVDFSQNALDTTMERAEACDVAGRVSTRCMDLLEMGQLERTYDLVVGIYVLHHLEPFSRVVDGVADILKPGGRGVFMENNAQNPLLMLMRRYVAGRFGIPKYGDDEEYPLKPEEIDLLRTRFHRVERHFYEFVFFRKLSTYIFRHDERFRAITDALLALDRFIYKAMPSLRKYSYIQIVEFEKASGPRRVSP